mmetsp:Transcript_23778/g.56229  ORF Transcript_23778/g.56229 Transcript_23778/m.56229 type:complete len:529 (-) Transcript_23778:127-1713(-)
MAEPPAPAGKPPARFSAESAKSVIATRASAALSTTKSAVDLAFPRIGDLPFGTFVSFASLLFAFTAFTDTMLCIVLTRARALDQFFFPIWVESLNIVWMCVQFLLLADLMYVFFRYYRPRAEDLEKPKMSMSQVRQPKVWYYCVFCMRARMTSRGYLLLLALLLPMNALLFYNGLGRPVYTPSQLTAYNVTELLAPEFWPRGSRLEVDLSTWEVFQSDNRTAFTPPLIISSRECYSSMSGEYRLLGRLRAGPGGVAEEFPKQAYCEALVGTMMAGSFEQPPSVRDRTWQHDEDTWDEALEFALRLFSALAGIVADQSEGANTQLSMVGFSFLKDMTDVFDMFMLTFVDVDQMHEGRPVLTHNYGLDGYDWSYHDIVFVLIWVGMLFVLLRALAVIGFTPFVFVFQLTGCSCTSAELRKPIDAFCSMLFIELPFLTVRWVAWRHYGVPVSVMAVKNLLGIYEDLYMIGVLDGFGEDRKPRGIRLCCTKRGRRDESPEESAEGGSGPEAVEDRSKDVAGPLDGAGRGVPG